MAYWIIIEAVTKEATVSFVVITVLSLVSSTRADKSVESTTMVKAIRIAIVTITELKVCWKKTIKFVVFRVTKFMVTTLCSFGLALLDLKNAIVSISITFTC